MTRQARPGSVETPCTLSDADITSERAVTRRSLLGVLGVGAGIAATVAFGTAESAPAADSDKAKDTKDKDAKDKDSKGKKKAPPKEEADSD